MARQRDVQDATRLNGSSHAQHMVLVSMLHVFADARPVRFRQLLSLLDVSSASLLFCYNRWSDTSDNLLTSIPLRLASCPAPRSASILSSTASLGNRLPALLPQRPEAPPIDPDPGGAISRRALVRVPVPNPQALALSKHAESGASLSHTANHMGSSWLCSGDLHLLAPGHAREAVGTARGEAVFLLLPCSSLDLLLTNEAHHVLLVRPRFPSVSRVGHHDLELARLPLHNLRTE